MLKAKIYWVFTIGFLVSFFYLAAPVQATELTISSSSRMEGLTFLTPFYLPNDPAINTSLLSNLQFGTPNTLFITSKPLATSLPDLIASPLLIPTPTATPAVEE